MGSVDGDHTVVHSCFVKRIVEADCQIKYRNIRHFFQLLPVLLPVHQPEAQFLLYLLKILKKGNIDLPADSVLLIDTDDLLNNICKGHATLISFPEGIKINRRCHIVLSLTDHQSLKQHSVILLHFPQFHCILLSQHFADSLLYLYFKCRNLHRIPPCLSEAGSPPAFSHVVFPV